MASFYKRKGSPYYQVQYRNAAGKLVQRSTGCKLKREAEEVVAEWQREERLLRRAAESLQPQFVEIITLASREANSGALTLDKARRYITQLYRLSSGEEFPNYTVASWLDQWLEVTLPQVETSTKNRYTKSIEDVKAALGKIGKKDIALLSTKDMESVQNKLMNGNRKSSTINFKMQDFKSAVTAASDQGFIERNVGRPVKSLPTGDSDIRVAFEAHEITTLIEAAKPDWQGAILIGAHTGLRMTNVAELKWRDVDLKNGVFTLKPVKQRKGARKVVTIPISTPVRKFLKKRESSVGTVFPNLAGRKTATLSTTFSNLMKKAGVPKEVELPGGDVGKRSFHSLRHFFISSLANQGVAEDVRRSLSAHESKDVHRLYTSHDQLTLKNAIDTLPSL